MFRRFGVGVMLAVVAAWTPNHTRIDAQGSAALTGAVSSQQEGKMEGVLVTARRDGANFTVTVVSDAQGRYSFPRTHLDSGKYALTIRATGYDLAGPGVVDITAQRSAELDLTLQKTKDVTRHLTSLEWTMAMPLTPEQKARLTYQGASCNYCHSLQRVVRSTHTLEQWPTVIRRMSSYYPDGSAHSDDGRAWGRRLMKFGDSY